MDLLAEARRIHGSMPVVDGHNDLPWALRDAGHANLTHIDLATVQPEFHTDIPRLERGGVGVQFWSVWVPASDPQPRRSTLDQIDLVHRMVESYPDRLSLAANVEQARTSTDRVAGFLGAEGGHSIENDLDALREFHGLGVRYLTLTHTRTIDWADSATDEARHGGLTSFGRTVVREMNRLGMAVDLAHCSIATMHDALDVSEAPVMSSHSSAHALAAHPRNIPDDVLRRIGDHGGIVMVCFYPPFVVPATAQRAVELLDIEQAMRARGVDEEEIGAVHDREWAANPPDVGSVSDVADHIEHMAEVAGVDHVGLGSDFDGCVVPNVIGDVTGVQRLFAALAEHGYDAGLLTKLARDNWLGCLERTWGPS